MTITKINHIENHFSFFYIYIYTYLHVYVLNVRTLDLRCKKIRVSSVGRHDTKNGTTKSSTYGLVTIGTSFDHNVTDISSVFRCDVPLTDPFSTCYVHSDFLSWVEKMVGDKELWRVYVTNCIKITRWINEYHEEGRRRTKKRNILLFGLKY